MSARTIWEQIKASAWVGYKCLFCVCYYVSLFSSLCCARLLQILSTCGLHKHQMPTQCPAYNQTVFQMSEACPKGETYVSALSVFCSSNQSICAKLQVIPSSVINIFQTNDAPEHQAGSVGVEAEVTNGPPKTKPAKNGNITDPRKLSELLRVTLDTNQRYMTPNGFRQAFALYVKRNKKIKVIFKYWGNLF